MKRLACLCLAAAALALGAAGTTAAPLEPELQRQPFASYERYSKAIAARKVNHALATRSAAARKRPPAAMEKPKDRAELLALAKFLAFDAVEVVHGTLAKDTKSATLIAIGTKKIPADAKLPPGAPAPGSIARLEMTLGFVKEAGAWKFDDQILGGDPDKIERCPDESFEPIE